MSGPEKFRAQRKKADYVVEFYDAEGLMLAGVGRVIDLSATGALLETGLRLTPGEILRLRLRRGGQADLELPVTVVRVRRKGTLTIYGVQFIRT